MENITLELSADTLHSGEAMKNIFLIPLQRFVRDNGLGIISEMDRDMFDAGNILEFSVYSPTDDYDTAQFSAWISIKADGTATGHNTDEEIFLRGTWLEICKWVVGFFAEIAKKGSLAPEVLDKLRKAVATLS
jgi:hypothetical protein